MSLNFVSLCTRINSRTLICHEPLTGTAGKKVEREGGRGERQRERSETPKHGDKNKDPSGRGERVTWGISNIHCTQTH